MSETIENAVNVPESEVDIYADLDPVDMVLVREKVSNPAITHTRLGEIVQLSVSAVQKRLKKVKLQHAISELTKEPLELLREAQPEAIRELRRQLRDTDVKVRQGAAKELIKGLHQFNVNLNGKLSVSAGAKRLLELMDAEDIDRMMRDEEVDAEG